MNTAVRLVAAGLWGLLFCGGPVLASQGPDQAESTGAAAAPVDGQSLNYLDALQPGGLFGGSAGADHLTLTGSFRLQPASREGRLALTAESAPGWYVYSITQQPGGPQASKIRVPSSDDFELTGDFQPDSPPRIKHYPYFQVPVEEQPGRVTWTAPIRVAEGVDPQTLAIPLYYSGQVCAEDGACIPISDREVVAHYAGEAAADAAAGVGEALGETGTAVSAGEGFRANRTHATLRGQAVPRAVRPGEEIQITLAAELDPRWHVYAYAERDPEEVSKPTLIILSDPAGWHTRGPVASMAPVPNPADPLDSSLAYYEGDVEWTLTLEVPSDAAAGDYEIRGLIGYQTCTDTRCDVPAGAEFRTVIHVGSERDAAVTPLEFTAARYSQVAGAAAERVERGGRSPQTSSARAGLDLDRLQTPPTSTADTPMIIVLLTAFVAGLLLNFMPCVLPVIGLKVMAFVQQAGDSRGRVFALNLWYCIGLLSVFLVLATLAVWIGLSWGQQFSSATFNVVLSAVVFVFALSFLGVWEIPIPGFVGSGSVQSLGEREGPSGAFAKGVLTTILATPCSGPMLTPALTWAVSQPPAVTYAGFTCVGLGMASPYLLIGIFPRLVSFLPKPGAWMDTFKHIMGFVLMGTVVFLLTFMPIPYVVPTVGFLIGLWAAFWWIGRTPLTEAFQVRLRAWLAAATFTVLVGLISYGWLLDIMDSRFQRAVDRALSARGEASVSTVAVSRGSAELPWQAFSVSRLQELTAEGKTVLVDFTADW